MSASIINTNKNIKIFSTNKINNIDVNTNNIIESDSEFREVIKKGYLLNQINLSAIPKVIQDALDKLIDDAKDATLSDSVIQNLKQSLESLDDGIYKKTYIDNTITYLENLLTSKVNLETVASIADNKITEATQNLVTTSQVQLLSSRIGNSESEITNVKNTINTKDTARANQILELSTSINETFAGYSEAIDLYVDAQGNVKSQKIETLSTNIGLQLQEVNQLIVNSSNEWKAKATKLITSPTGAITGYSFIDGSGLKSTFEINADYFKIANSYNTYTPFSIVGTSLYFNGKVAFTNISGTDGVVTTSNVQNVINNNVTTIDGGKIVTNSISADKINTTGLIAENISATNLVGKSISGSVITGSVIKASYLDLDGELEVLTNYHISVDMYNANPNLYIDAVYMSGTNEYRIPSISTIREATKSIALANTGILKGLMYSYNTANIGTNNKAVKISPVFTNTTSFNIVSATTSITHTGIINYMLGSWFRIKLGNIILFECKIEWTSNAGQWDGNLQIASATYSGAYFTSIYRSGNGYYGSNYDINYNDTVNIGIGQLSVNFFAPACTDTGQWQLLNVNCVLTSGSSQFPTNWDYGSLTLEQLSVPHVGSTTFSLNSSLYINNMI